MSTTTTPGADTAAPTTLALDGEQRRALDQYLRGEIETLTVKLGIDALMTLEPDAILYMLGEATALAETVRQVDDQMVTATADQLGAWIDGALADAEEAAEDYEHPADVERAERRDLALRDLRGDLDALTGEAI